MSTVPIYLTEEIFLRLRERADREHTTVNFLVLRILRDTLGPPEPRPRRSADAGAHPVGTARRLSR
jgi:hypothetical protein